MQTLREIANRFADGTNPTTKFIVPTMYDLYERHLRDLEEQAAILLELGVYTGESLKTFATRFPRWTIIGVDIEDRRLDFSGFPNVHFRQGDQTDSQRLNVICSELAPRGLDVIIDDASHFGAASLASYRALFPHLKPGGLYFVEDWATGYLTDWPDGGGFQEPQTLGRHIVSHDFGMVGFIKYLVDEVASRGIRPLMNAPLTRDDRLAELVVDKAAVVMRKASAPS